MRELTLPETGYLAGGLLLCLVLPLMMSFRSPRNVATKRLCMKTVWTGQGLLTLAGAAVLVSASVAPYAATCGLLSWIACVFVLLRQFEVVQTA
jgi:hypothetical protein